MIKNRFIISKKEATNYRGVVIVTANTGFKLDTSYENIEINIKSILSSCYNVSPFQNHQKLIAAWQVYNDPCSWAASVKSTPEYEWLEKLPKKDTSILVGLTGIYANSKTGTWWTVYTIIEKNNIFYKI